MRIAKYLINMKTYNGKTVEELAQLYKSSLKHQYGTSCLNHIFHLEGIQAVAEACTPKWISVEERLPDKMAGVICFGKWEWMPKSDPAYVFYGYLNDDSSWVTGNEDEHTHIVTHWMELPSKPEIES